MLNKNDHFFLKNALKYSAVLVLSFMLFGIIEIYNNVLFKVLYLGSFPNKLFPHFMPILFMHFIKSLQYVGAFLLVVVISFLVSKIISMVQDAREKTLSAKVRNILTLFYDLFLPLVLVYILFFDYGSGPFTLSYYFYFLSDTMSPVLKTIFGFDALNIVIKIMTSIICALLFIRFRISKYSGGYLTFFTLLIAMAILPGVVFLLHYFAGVLYKVALAIIILGLFATMLILLKKLITAGVHKWVETGLIALLLLSVAGNMYFYGATKNNRLNVVHIILDTLRMKSFNEENMPFLHSLKDKGVYFPNSYSSSDNTVTSHNAIYYGKYPSNVGLEHGPFPETTIMQVLRSHGYHTIVVSANGRFCLVNGFGKGVEDFYEAWKDDNHVRNVKLMADYELSEKFQIIDNFFNAYQEKIVNKPAYTNKKPFGHREYRYFNYEPAEVVNEFVKKTIESNPPLQPFYLFINYLDPHTPYLAPAPEKITAVVDRLKTDMPDIYDKLGFEHIAVSDSVIFQQIMLMWQKVDSLENKSLKDEFLTYCYKENINYLDQQMEELFSYFREKDLFDNTVFIVTSDHGESIGEHNLYEHGNKRLYNPEIRVPLFILFPEKLQSLIHNKVLNINTQSVDFFPTIVDLLGIKTDVDLNGESLFPYIVGLADSSEHGHSISEYTGVSAITDNAHKLIVRNNMIELYDLRQDPDEENNLTPAMPQRVNELWEKLKEMRQSTHAVSKGQLDSTDETRYDPETLKLLKTLGYIK